MNALYHDIDSCQQKMIQSPGDGVEGGEKMSDILSRFSENELSEIMEALQMSGKIKIKRGNAKDITLQEEAEKLGLNNWVLQNMLRQHIYGIADEIFENHETKVCKNGKTKDCKRQYIPFEIEQEYRRLLSSILAALKPYYVEEPSVWDGGVRGEFRYEKKD